MTPDIHLTAQEIIYAVTTSPPSLRRGPNTKITKKKHAYTHIYEQLLSHYSHQFMSEQIRDNSSVVAEYVQGNVGVLESVVGLLVQEDQNHLES